MIDAETLHLSSTLKQPYQAEKDYLEDAFLSGLFNTRTGLVFKGGSALSKVYGSAMFSDDLEFAMFNTSLDKPLKDIMDRFVENISTRIPLRILRVRDSEEMLSYELSIRGPLYEQLNKFQHLKIEIDKTSSVLESVEKRRMIPAYHDIKPYLVIALDQKEILSEKVVALLYRHNPKARDLYDLYFLIIKGTVLNPAIIDRKMREFGHVFTQDRFLTRINELGSIWEKELKRLIPENSYVDFEEACRIVVESFRMSGLI